MSIKTYGKTWKEFMADVPYWGERYIEEDELRINGADSIDMALGDLADTATVELCSGFLRNSGNPEEETDYVKFFRAWLRSRRSVLFLVEMPRESEDFFRGLITANDSRGLRIVS